MNLTKNVISLICLLVLFGCAASQKSTSQLISDMGNADREIRLSAAYVLSERGEDAVKPLIIALDDPDKGVQYAAMWSLYNIGNAEAIKALKSMIPTLKKDIQNPDQEFQEAAREMLQAINEIMESKGNKSK